MMRDAANCAAPHGANEQARTEDTARVSARSLHRVGEVSINMIGAAAPRFGYLPGTQVCQERLAFDYFFSCLAASTMAFSVGISFNSGAELLKVRM